MVGKKLEIIILLNILFTCIVFIGCNKQSENKLVPLKNDTSTHDYNSMIANYVEGIIYINESSIRLEKDGQVILKYNAPQKFIISGVSHDRVNKVICFKQSSKELYNDTAHISAELVAWDYSSNKKYIVKKYKMNMDQMESLLNYNPITKSGYLISFDAPDLPSSLFKFDETSSWWVYDIDLGEYLLAITEDLLLIYDTPNNILNRFNINENECKEITIDSLDRYKDIIINQFGYNAEYIGSANKIIDDGVVWQLCDWNSSSTALVYHKFSNNSYNEKYYYFYVLDKKNRIKLKLKDKELIPIWK